jgi:hypothetical protein
MDSRFLNAIKYFFKNDYCHPIQKSTIPFHSSMMISVVLKDKYGVLTPHSDNNVHLYDSLKILMEVPDVDEPYCIDYKKQICKILDRSSLIFASAPFKNFLYFEVRNANNGNKWYAGIANAFLFEFDVDGEIMNVYKEVIHYQ